MRIGNDENYMDWNNEEADTLVIDNAKIKGALKVLKEALIAGFYFSDERIRSTLMSGDDFSLLLDGRNGKIKLVSSNSGGDYSTYLGDGSNKYKSTIDIDSSQGMVEVRNKDGVAYMSASGIFCNNAKTNALPSSSGYTHYGSIVGLGFGNVNNDWAFDKDSTIIAGVYGRASNSGTALAYGGYFADLMASGLILRQKYITDSQATTPLNLGGGYTHLVGLSNKDKMATVYLPTDGYEGKVIWAKQIGQGAMRFYPRSGQKIFDDISENEYYTCEEGYELKFVFARFILNSNDIEAWLVSKYKY